MSAFVRWGIAVSQEYPFHLSNATLPVILTELQEAIQQDEINGLWGSAGQHKTF